MPCYHWGGVEFHPPTHTRPLLILWRDACYHKTVKFPVLIWSSLIPPWQEGKGYFIRVGKGQKSWFPTLLLLTRMMMGSQLFPQFRAVISQKVSILLGCLFLCLLAGKNRVSLGNLLAFIAHWHFCVTGFSSTQSEIYATKRKPRELTAVSLIRFHSPQMV